MEGSNDCRGKSRLERSLSDNHTVKTWMAGTSPAMTMLNAMPRSPQRIQFAGQRVGPLGDGAGAEADDEIAAAGDLAHHACEIGGFLQRNHLAVAMRAQAEDEMIAVDALDRRLPGGIDVSDHDRVGVVETGTKFLEQRLQPGEAMRLHHGNDLAVGGFPSRSQHRRDFNRMMAVVIDNGDAVIFAGFGEAPPHAAETCQRLSDGVVGKAKFVRNRDRGRGVERVVASRHRRNEIGDLMRGIGLAIAKRDLEAGTAAVWSEIDEPRVGLRDFAVGVDAAILVLAYDGLHYGMIAVHHLEAAERHGLDKNAERLRHGIEGLEMIEMLGIDIGDDGDIGRQLQESAVAL